MDSFNIQNYFKRGKTVVLTLRQGDDEGSRQWSDKETNDLIKQMKHFLPEFQNQRRRKKDVWEDVANELQKYGNSWTPEDCRKKWSNMIRTFRGIEEQKTDSVNKFKKIKWPFYDLMYQILSLHGSDNLPECQTVVQLLKNGGLTASPSGSGHGGSGGGSGIYSRNKVNPLKPSTFSAPNVNVPLHSSLIDSQQTILQLSHPDNDVMSLGVSDDHHGSTSDLHTSDGLDGNLLFSDEPIHRFPSRMEQAQPQPVASSSPTVSSSYNKPKTVFAARPKKRPFKKKMSKLAKNSGNEPVDNILAKFMDDTSKQNEMILEKLTSFHENTLTVMQERNELLREIRDSLQEGRHSSSGDLNDSMDMDHTDGQGAETLTLHMGPAFTTNVASTSHSGANVVSQLNSTLVLSDAAAANALSTFQLVDDGTVLTTLDAQGKTVLANLGSFNTDSGMFHPTLVSVVQDSNVANDTSEISLMTSPTSAAPQPRRQKRMKRECN